MEYLIPILIISILILLNGFFVAAEFAIVGAPHTRIAQRADEGSTVARHVLDILQDTDRQNRYLATAQVGITIASLGLGMYGEHAIADWLVVPLESLGRLASPAAHSIAAVLSIGLLTYLHVVIGEMIPKSIALQSAETTVLRLERPMTIMDKIFLPVVVVLNGIGNGIMKLIGIPPAEPHARLMSPEELEMIVEESYVGGLIQADEQLFIENIFDLSERTVGQVMTPRTRIVGLPVSADEKMVLTRACEARFTRLPIFEDGLDQIIGVLHIKDLARQQIHPQEGFNLRKIARQTVFVPESLSLEDMLTRFRRERFQMAVVMDEFGGTAGLVTIEDVVEEVVGEILDEFDQEIAPIHRIRPGRLRVRGDLLLDELNQHYRLNLEHPDADTVGGLLMASLGRVLNPGDAFTTQSGVHLEVETVKGLAVQTVLVDIPRKEEAREPGTKTGQSEESRLSGLSPKMKEAPDTK
jgi:CBS domain containing-hemolysin-like protein